MQNDFVVICKFRRIDAIKRLSIQEVLFFVLTKNVECFSQRPNSLQCPKDFANQYLLITVASITL